MPTVDVRVGTQTQGANHHWKTYDVSAADTPLTVVAEAGTRMRYLIGVLVRYSASVTANAVVTFDAAHGAAYDATIHTIALSAATAGSFFPDVPIPMAPGDKIEVVAAAGGGAVTSAVTILTEER